MKAAILNVLYLVGCMLAAMSLFCGVWNVFLAYAGPSEATTDGISRMAGGASAFAFGIMLVVFIAGLKKTAADSRRVLDLVKSDEDLARARLYGKP